MHGVGQLVSRVLLRVGKTVNASDVAKQINHSCVIERFPYTIGTTDDYGTAAFSFSKTSSLKSILKRGKMEESVCSGRQIRFNDDAEVHEIPLNARRHFSGVPKKNIEHFYVVEYTKDVRDGERIVKRLDDKTYLLKVGGYQRVTWV